MGSKEIEDKLLLIEQSQKEPFLFPILKELFIAMKYLDVEITHGNNEYGKDLVFKEYDEKLDRYKWFSVVVKNRKATDADFDEGGEISRQISKSFEMPYLDNRGKKQFINEVIVIINSSITYNAKQLLSESKHPSQLNNVSIWNRKNITSNIHEYIKESFLGTHEFHINKYKIEQQAELSKIEYSKRLFQNLDINTIDDIFVNVQTSYNRRAKEEAEYIYENSKSLNTELVDDAVEILGSHKNYIIHGLPTSGKTLLLKRIGTKALEVENERKLIGVFYFELAKLARFEDVEFTNLIMQQYARLSGSTIDFSKFSKILLLLDGFDEVHSKDDQLKLKNSIYNYVENFNTEVKNSKLQILITSRTSGIFETNYQDSKFDRIELFPFNITQALKLIEKVIPNDKRKTNSFTRALKNQQLTTSLTRTPMAITLMAILYRDNEIDVNELPANITEIYNKFTDYYLNRWDPSKGISLQYKYEETKQILAEIANKLHVENVTEIHKNDLHQFLVELSSKYSYEDLKNIDEFMYSLQSRIGLVSFDNDSSIFKFYNHTFQEYFTSVKYNDENELELEEKFMDEWWENTIVFYCGLNPKREKFIKSINSNVVPVQLEDYYKCLTLKSKCLQASHLISRQTKSEIIKSLINTFNLFIKKIFENDKSHDIGISKMRTTIQLIVDARDLLHKLFNSKHISIEDLESLALDLLIDKYEEFHEITLYSIAYFVSVKSNDAEYLTLFSKIKTKSLVWDRIIYVDIDRFKLSNIDEKEYRRIKRKQFKNRSYIMAHLNKTAFEHLYN